MGYLFDALNRGASGSPNTVAPAVSSAIKNKRATSAAAPAPAASDALTPEAQSISSDMLDLVSSELSAQIPPSLEASQLAADLSGVPLKLVGASAPTSPSAVGVQPAPKASSTATDVEQIMEELAVDAPEYDERLVTITDPDCLISEEYRSIRTSILARWQQKRQLTHVLTSATPQEGKTFTSLNLGQCFHELSNRRTLVLEADLRLPKFGSLLNIPENSNGLIQLLQGKCDLASAIHKVGPQGLFVLPAGGYVGNQAVQMLSSHPMSELMKLLRRKFDHVIIDTPPVTELADAGILGAMADEVLMIVRMDHTPRHLVELAIRTLTSYNAPVAGLIATHHESYRRWYFKRYGYQNYYHNQTQNVTLAKQTAAKSLTPQTPKQNPVPTGEPQTTPLRRAA